MKKRHRIIRKKEMLRRKCKIQLLKIFLQKHNAYHGYIKNILYYKNHGLFNNVFQLTSMANYMYTFIWVETSEGSEYWYNLYNCWINFIKKNKNIIHGT